MKFDNGRDLVSSPHEKPSGFIISIVFESTTTQSENTLGRCGGVTKNDVKIFSGFLESFDRISSIHDVQTHQMYKFGGSYLCF